MSDDLNKSLPSICVTLTRYAESNELVLETLAGLAEQTVDCHVLFLDQQDNQAMREATLALGNERVTFDYVVIPAKSLSYARNEAIRMNTHDVLLYIDSDAIPADTWAERLAAAFLDTNVAVAGGRIVPKWHRSPLLIARAPLVLDQYSVLDLGEDTRPTTRVVGASFGIHPGRLGDVARFDEALGRRPGILLGGEESDLMNRAMQAGFKGMYVGGALVQHQILPERIQYRWILRRMYYQGVSKAMVGGAPKTSNPPTLWNYLVLPVVLPFYLWGYLAGRRMRDQG